MTYLDDRFNREWLANVRPAQWRDAAPDGRYNLVVIGGGSGGLVSAIGAAGLGAKAALVEKHLLGGDCLNFGCVPSKAVLRAAKVLGDVQRAVRFGVQVPAGTAVDFGAVMQRMRAVRAEISHHDSAQRVTDAGVDLYLGEGRFTGADTIEVNGQTLAFKKAIIATGSRPAAPPIPGLAEAGYLTNETVFDLTERPSRLAVIGAGPVGVELAQAFCRFGAQVTLFDVAARALPREDREAAAIVQESLARDGVALRLGVEITEVRREGEQTCITYTQNGAQQVTAVDRILVAAGRSPNVESLNLAAAGIACTEQGLAVNDRLQTTNPAVYGVGDVAAPVQFTHVADAMARMALQNALFLGRKKVSDLVIPWVTYTDPEVAQVGLHEAAAREQGVAVDTFRIDLAETDRGRTDGVTEGFVKIHVRRGGDKIVGATIVAAHAGEMIGEITLAMTTGAGLKTLAQVIHPYPTQAEAIRKAADAYNRTRLTPLVASLFQKWLSWTR